MITSFYVAHCLKSDAVVQWKQTQVVDKTCVIWFKLQSIDLADRRRVNSQWSRDILRTKHRNFLKNVSKHRSVIKWLWCSAQDQRIPGSSPGHTWSIYLHIFTSAVRLIKGQVVCGLPVIHAIKKTLGLFEKSRGISLVPDFQFWQKS
jgi:hypothetical protein